MAKKAAKQKQPRELLREEIGLRMDGDNNEPDERIKEKKVRDFVDAFVEMGAEANAKSAAIKAGYAERSAAVYGTRNMSDPLVRSWIAYRTVLSNLEVQLDKDWVKRRLMREADYTGPGSQQGARVQALNKLGVIVGLWDEGNNDEDEIAITINKRV